MGFGVNITPVKVTKKRAFRGTDFRNGYSSVNSKWYKNSWKEFNHRKILRKSIIAQIIMMLVLINMASNVKHC